MKYLLIATLTALGLAAVPTSDELLRDADAAFARGDYAAAATLYERVEPRAPDPGQVTLRLAASKYRLALEDPSRSKVLFEEAEALFRSVLDPAEDRRAEALLGVGNSLLQQAEGRAAAARAAAEQYVEVERAAPSTELSETARHNLQRARLLAGQIPTAAVEKPDPPPGGDAPPRSSEKDAAASENRGDASEGKRQGSPRPVKPEAGQHATPQDDAPPPGQGNLPPVPDRDDAPPLSPREALAHLELAAQHIREESQRHRHRSASVPAATVRDW